MQPLEQYFLVIMFQLDAVNLEGEGDPVRHADRFTALN